ISGGASIARSVVTAINRHARTEGGGRRALRADLIAVPAEYGSINEAEILGREVDCARIALEVAVDEYVRPVGSCKAVPQRASRRRLDSDAGVLHRSREPLVQAVVGDAVGLLGLQGAFVESRPSAIVALRIAAHVDAAIAGHPQIAGGVDHESARIRMRGRSVAGVRKRDA